MTRAKFDRLVLRAARAGYVRTGVACEGESLKPCFTLALLQDGHLPTLRALEVELLALGFHAAGCRDGVPVWVVTRTEEEDTP